MPGPPLTQITVRVGYTTVRPIVPDQHHSYVTVAATGFTDASLVAAQMVATRRGVEMVTSTKLIYPAMVTTTNDTRAALRRILQMGA